MSGILSWMSEYRTLPYRDYWEKVGEQKDGNWKKYEILPRFAQGLGSQLNSNSECERKFTFQTKMAGDSTRNRMSQDVFDAHLQNRSGVESELSRKGCEKSNNVSRKEEAGIETKGDHCHCCSAPVSELMLENCRKASHAYRTELDEKKVQSEEVMSNLKKVEVVREKKDQEQVDQMKKSLQNRLTFLPPNKMTRVWETDKEIKDRKKLAEKEKERGSVAVVASASSGKRAAAEKSVQFKSVKKSKKN